MTVSDLTQLRPNLPHLDRPQAVVVVKRLVPEVLALKRLRDAIASETQSQTATNLTDHCKATSNNAKTVESPEDSKLTEVQFVFRTSQV